METWKDISGYEGYYQVSDYGGVRRIKSPNRPIERRRKIQYKKNGYAVVMLSVNQKYKLVYVHRLVALAFISNPHNKPQVNHKDLNKQNNALSNLEWVTNKENTEHALRNKKWCNNARSGKDNPVAVSVNQYSKEGVFINNWDTISEAALQNNMSSGAISMCCKFKRKTAGGFQWRYAKDKTKVHGIDYGRRRVLQFSIDNSFIKEYDSAFVASKTNKLSHAGIWNCCNGVSKHCGNYLWRYKS